MDLNEVIEERRAEIERLQGELEQLEAARELVAGVLGGKPMKPPPPVRKGKPVRTEKPEKQPRTKAGDKHFAACGHPTAKENQTSQGRCLTCARESQRKWYAANKAKKSGKEPSAKAEPDPAPLASIERAKQEVPKPRAAIAVVSAVPPLPAVTKKSSGLVLNEAERAALLERANRWRGQCSAVNELNRRCSLLYPHDGPHNASGRTFTTAVPAGSALPRREADEAAFRARGE